jgi:hypothetical protein
MKKLLIGVFLLPLSTMAFAEPKDLPEKETRPEAFQSQKPVICTNDPYDKVKQNFLQSHGEVGLMRYMDDTGTGVEVIGNVDTGTITILEFIPSIKATCFISMGKGLEINSNIFRKANKGIPTKFIY